MIICGIDPSVQNVGWVVVEGDKTFTLKDFGVFHTKRDESIRLRLIDIKKFISSLDRKYKPAVYCIEEVDFRPFYPSKTQAVLFSSYAVVLVTIPEKIDVVTYRKHIVNQYLKIPKGKTSADRKKNIIKYYSKYVDFVSEKVTKKDLEHVFDALAVVETFLRYNGFSLN